MLGIDHDLEFEHLHLTLGLLSMIITYDSLGNYIIRYTSNACEIMLTEFLTTRSSLEWTQLPTWRYPLRPVYELEQADIRITRSTHSTDCGNRVDI